MKKKRMQRWIAMLLAAAMLSSAMESTGLAQTLESENTVTENQEQIQETSEELKIPENVKTWEDAEKSICQMLGYLSEDGANLKLTEEADRDREILIAKDVLTDPKVLEYGGQLPQIVLYFLKQGKLKGNEIPLTVKEAVEKIVKEAQR